MSLWFTNNLNVQSQKIRVKRKFQIFIEFFFLLFNQIQPTRPVETSVLFISISGTAMKWKTAWIAGNFNAQVCVTVCHHCVNQINWTNNKLLTVKQKQISHLQTFINTFQRTTIIWVWNKYFAYKFTYSLILSHLSIVWFCIDTWKSHWTPNWHRKSINFVRKVVCIQRWLHEISFQI